MERGTAGTTCDKTSPIHALNSSRSMYSVSRPWQQSTSQPTTPPSAHPPSTAASSPNLTPPSTLVASLNECPTYSSTDSPTPHSSSAPSPASSPHPPPSSTPSASPSPTPSPPLRQHTFPPVAIYSETRERERTFFFFREGGKRTAQVDRPAHEPSCQTCPALRPPRSCRRGLV